jgi:UDPglucose 6-dehydrogenase
MDKARNIFPNIHYGESAYDAAADADAIVIVTEWNEFKQLNLERLKGLMRTPVLYDGRNIYDPHRMRRMGFRYTGIGRPRAANAGGAAGSSL